MSQLVGRNEGVEYVKGMVRQRESHTMEYPSGTNMRGDAREHRHREHHAAGDMVGMGKATGGMLEESRHNEGDMVRKLMGAHADGDMVKKARGGQMRERGMGHADGDVVVKKAMGGQIPQSNAMMLPRHGGVMKPMPEGQPSAFKRGGAMHRKHCD